MSKKLITRFCGNHICVKVYKEYDWQEYVARLFINGKERTEASYHCDDKEECMATAKLMLQQALSKISKKWNTQKTAQLHQWLEQHGSLVVCKRTSNLHYLWHTFKSTIQKYDDDAEGAFDMLGIYNVPPLALSDNSHQYWKSSEAKEDVFETFVDLLTEIAPEGFYFGVRPNSSSYFGFWPNEA